MFAEQGLDTSAAVPALAAVARDDPDSNVRDGASRALAAAAARAARQA